MKIEWNRVTWYSKLLAVIIFVGTFFLAFYLGEEYGRALGELKTAPSAESSSPTPINTKLNAQEVINNVIFSCPDGKSIHAVFRKSNRVDLILSDKRQMTLPQVISASGARYANEDESFVFWNKGDSAFVEESGTITYKDCVIIPSGK